MPREAPPLESRPSWFEQNPKKTLLLCIFLLILAATYATEKVLAYINHSKNLVLFTERRYINLREYLPNLDVVDVPPAKTLRESDGLEKKEYRVRTDAHGFILPYHSYDKPDATLIFLGASTTACIYVGEAERFPYLVGNILEQETGKRVTSINAGVGGNNSLHSLDILLNKVMPLRPDIVVMMHNINDLAALIYDKTYWSKNPTRAPIVSLSFYKNLQGFRALSTLARDLYIPNLHAAFRVLSKKIFRKGKDPEDEFAHARGQKVELHPAPLVDEFKMNLQAFINLCRARRITPVLMTQFNRVKTDPDGSVNKAMKGFQADSGIPPAEFKAIYDRFNEAIREVGRDNEVLVIDLARLIPQDQQYMYDIVHLNAAGSRRVAQVISEHLRKLIVQGSGIRDQGSGKTDLKPWPLVPNPVSLR